jgi:hypothetical protein
MKVLVNWFKIISVQGQELSAQRKEQNSSLSTAASGMFHCSFAAQISNRRAHSIPILYTILGLFYWYILQLI